MRLLAIAILFLGALSASSCGKGKKVPGIDHFSAGVHAARLYVTFVSERLTWDTGLTVPIPGLKDALVSVAPDLNSAGTVFQFSIGVESLLNGGKPLPHSGLPDGRALPDVQGGTLPRWDADIKGLTLSLYLSNDAFAIFVPLTLRAKNGFNLPFIISLEIKDERGNRLGRAYAIPSGADDAGSGLFLLLPYLARV